jgi:glutathione S-transferase
VQRAVIAMRAKKVEFEVTYINLREKPDWFLKLSPHGKVPVLSVNDQPLFESNAIAEYLDETVPPRLHPEDPIKRARNRAWTDFVPDFAKGLSGIYYPKTSEEMQAGLEAAPARVQRLEDAIAGERGNDGPYFNGDALCLVDAAYAPFLQRFAFVDRWLKTGLMDSFPLVKAWSDALLANETVTGAVAPNFEEEFVANLKRREFYVATLIEKTSQAAE